MKLRTVGRAALLVVGVVLSGEIGTRPVWAADAGAAAAVVPPPRADGRLPASEVRPLGYALELVLDPAQPRFSGRVRIKVRLKTATRAIVLHAKELEVQRA